MTRWPFVPVILLAHAACSEQEVVYLSADIESRLPASLLSSLEGPAALVIGVGGWAPDSGLSTGAATVVEVVCEPVDDDLIVEESTGVGLVPDGTDGCIDHDVAVFAELIDLSDPACPSAEQLQLGRTWQNDAIAVAGAPAFPGPICADAATRVELNLQLAEPRGG